MIKILGLILLILITGCYSTETIDEIEILNHSEIRNLTIELDECNNQLQKREILEIYKNQSSSFHNTGVIEITTDVEELSCCYPSECWQAKDNPEDCTCTYAIACGTLEELGIKND
jgi:hypothetical protein